MPYNQQTCLGLSGDVLEEGSYTIEITGTMLLSVLGNPYSVEGIVLTHQIEVTPNTDGIPGLHLRFRRQLQPDCDVRRRVVCGGVARALSGRFGRRPIDRRRRHLVVAQPLQLLLQLI